MRLMSQAKCLTKGLCLLLLFAVGCQRGGAGREENDPVFRKAEAIKKTGDTQALVNFYQTALLKKPRLARLHLELAGLYSENKNYVRSIYHYESYLALQPKTEKRQLIEEAIDEQRAKFALSIPENAPAVVREAARLQRENGVLQEKIVELQGQIKQLTLSGASAVASQQKPLAGVTADEAAPPDTKPVSGGQIYKVKRGDTLGRIAKQFYGDANAWQAIVAANSTVLKGPRDVREGMALTMPPRAAKQSAE